MNQMLIGSSFRPQALFSPNFVAPVAPQPNLLNTGSFSGSLLGFPALTAQPSFGNLSGINSAFLGVQDRSMAAPQMGMTSLMALLEQMIQMFMMMVAASTAAGVLSGFGAPGSGLGGYNGGSGGGIVPASSGGGGGGLAAAGGRAPGAGSAPPTAGATATPGSKGPVSIGPGTRVLEIGDSHSVGTFGKELDAKLRGTGAQVSTYASAGATASTFTQGKSTKYGYWEKKSDGSERTVGYGTSAQTPKLDQLIAREKPNVILVNLGANFRQSDPKSQVDEIGRIAQKHGIPIVWVGPPKTAKDSSNPSSLQRFDQQMAAAVAPYGTYISSARHTPKYAGGDGIHYGGSEGQRLARQWADGIFREVAGR